MFNQIRSFLDISYNIGGKIKSVSKAFCLIGVVVSILTGASLMPEENPAGLLLIFICPFCLYVGSFIMYGFGELIEKVTEIAENTKKQDSNAE